MNDRIIKITCTGAATIPINMVEPFQGSLKTLSKRAFHKLKKSLVDFGFSFPLFVWRNSGHFWTIDGHQRVATLKEMQKEGWSIPELPVVWIDAKDQKEAKHKLLLAVGAYGKVTDEGLYEFIHQACLEMKNLDDTIELSDFDFSKFLKGHAPESSEPPEPSLSKGDALRDSLGIREGQIWKAGDHCIACGSCLDSDTAEKLIKYNGGGRADIMITDPPYNVDYKGKTKDALTVANDSMSDNSFREFLKSAMEVSFSAIKPGASFYIFHADLEGHNFRGAIHDIGQKVRQCLIWEKNSMVLGRQDYQSMHEPCLYGWKEGGSHQWFSDRKQTTILKFDRPQRNAEHPTMKPIDMIKYLLDNSCPPSGVVYDPFSGSGTTLLAAEQTGRKCLAIELSPSYVAVALQRWMDMTDKKIEQLE